MNPLKSEPAIVMALVESVVALGASFGLNLTGEQVGGIMTVAALVTGIFVRSRVSPTPPPPEAPK